MTRLRVFPKMDKMAINISATELKNKISEILNLVYFKNTSAIIERHGKAIAKIVPIETAKKDKTALEEALKTTFGSMPDFPDVTRNRRSRKKKIALDL